MSDRKKTKAQLIEELQGLRQQVAALQEAQKELEQTEEMLQRQRAEQQIVFDSVPAMIWFKDTENRILRLNNAAAEAMGLTVEEVEGKSVYELNPNEADHYHQDDLAVINSEKPKVGIIEPLVTASGETRWLQTDKIPYRNEQGDVTGVIVFAIDITERKRAEEALQRTHEELEQRVEERTAELAEASTKLKEEIAERKQTEEALLRERDLLNTLMDTVPDFIFFKDVESRIIRTNQAHAKFLGLDDPAEAVGKIDFDFWDHDEAQRFYDEEQQIIQTNQPIIDRLGQTPDPDTGEVRWLTESKMPMTDEAGQVVGLVGISRDITEWIQARAERERLLAEVQQSSSLLEERVKQLDCLNDIGRKIDEAPPVPEFLEWVAQRIPPATRHPDSSAAAIELEGQIYGMAEAIELPCQMVQSLRVGGEVAGRLYVDYSEERDFIDGDSALLGGIARRVSGYIENRRLFEQTQEALAEVEAAHRAYLERRWEDYLRQREILRKSGFVYDQVPAGSTDPGSGESEPARVVTEPDFWRPEIGRSLAKGQLVTTKDSEDGDQRTGLAVPIVLRGQTIGVLGLEDPQGVRHWSEEDQTLVEAVGRQLALALENARLLEESQRRAARERVNREITDRMRRAPDMDHLLQTVVQEMATALGTSSAFVQLSLPSENNDGDGRP